MKTSIITSFVKALEKKYDGAGLILQDIWIRATEGYMDFEEDLVATDEEVAFLKDAFEEIKSRGEQIENYSEMELKQIHTLLVSAIYLNRGDLIMKAGISEDYIDDVEKKLKKEGDSFI